jgi:hypothetical protein
MPSKLSPDFVPGTFGFHEMVDRAYLIAELFSREIACHPAANHPKLAKRIERLDKGLFQLYQEAGGLDAGSAIKRT